MTAWLNPNDLPGGIQVRVWPFDDDGTPNEQPVTLETGATYTKLSRDDAVRVGRALLAAADRIPEHQPAEEA